MKKYLLALCLATSVLGANREHSALTQTPLTFAESYGVGSYGGNFRPTDDPFYGSGFDVPKAIAAMPDGGMVVAGQIDFPKLYAPFVGNPGTSGRANAVLVRLGPDGSILWHRELHQSNDRVQYFNGNGYYYAATTRVSQLVVDAAGNIFVAGGKGNPDNAGSFPFVAKFSPDGDLLWQKGIPHGVARAGSPPVDYTIGVSGAYYMSATNDGGVVVSLLQGKPYFVGGVIPVLAKFNTDGTLALYRAYENPPQFYGDSPVAQSRDGSRYVMALWAYLPNGSGSTLSTLLLVLDASGNILAQNGWLSPDGAQEQPIALISTSDGGFASLSYVADYAGGVLRKYNADLSATIFEKRIRAANNRHLWMTSLSETPDGGLLIGGETAGDPDFTGTQFDLFLLKVSAAGALEFSSLIGGARNDGGPFGNGVGNSVAIALPGGGYGLAATTASYSTDGTSINNGYSFKPDWWVVKTDANRQVRNFTGLMGEESLAGFSVAGSPQPPIVMTSFQDPNYTYGPAVSTLPTFEVLDVGDFLPPNSPTFMLQGSSPRIVSLATAKATVEQHFTYQVATAYFPPSATITYSAAGLPAGFAINATTGVISGAPQDGSQTTTPLAITLQATDGTDTAQLVLRLTIAAGLPAFKVNGSDQPAYPNPSATPPSNVADTILTFTASQPGALAGRVVRVQASTNPDDASTWHTLTNGTEGFMVYDSISRKYILGSTEYPHAPAVYFRAQTRAPAKPDAYSNVVGPFDLSSTASRLGTTKLYITRNGLVANIRFGVTAENAPSGLAVKMQTTKTPGVEGSWTDVANGALAQDGVHPNEFYLGFDDYPPGEGIYFRALATNSGHVPSASGPQGPFTFIPDPTTVTLTVPHSGSNDGTDFDFPIVVSSGSFDLSTMVTSTLAVRQLSLDYDADLIENFGGAGQGHSLYTSNVVGDHLIEAVAVDALGIAAHARPVHVRVAPVLPGKIRYLATSGGSWTNPATWIDENGNSGVPGPEDLAVLSSLDVIIPQAVTIRAVSMNGGNVSGAGKLTITGFFTIGGGRIANNIDILSGATMLMINDLDVGLGGRVNNFGRLKIHGKGGIGSYAAAGAKAGDIPNLGNPFPAIVNWFKTTFFPPAGGRGGSHPTPTPAPSPTPAPEVRSVLVSSLQNAGKIGLIGNDGASLITNDGGSLITNDGGSLIGNDGGGLFDKNGNRIVAQGGGNIVAQGGGNIISTNGGGIVAQGGGNIVATGGGNIVAQGGGNIVAQGGGNRPQNKVAAEQLDSPATAPTLTQVAGETDLSGITILGGVSVAAGTLNGTGAIIGDLANTGGLVVPGNGTTGSFGVTGTFGQSGGGSLQVETSGGNPSQFDQVQAGGGATLGGRLLLHTQNGYVPLANDSFSPVGYSNVSGAFTSVSANVQATPLSTGINSVLTPGAPNPFTLLSAVSRKTQGIAGIYDLPLSLGQPIGVECRSSGGQHTLVFTFNNPIASGSASVASGTGQIVGAPSIDGRSMTVSLTGVTNAQRLNVTLSGVTDTAGQVIPTTNVTVGFLVGDVSGNGTVSSSDIAQVKTQAGQEAGLANFRTDVNGNGNVSSSDIALVKSASGTQVPP